MCSLFVKDQTRPQFWGSGASISTTAHRRGYSWACFRPLYGQVNTILPPNRELCIDEATGNRHNFAMIAPPGSRHQGGCHVLMADAAVKFITDSIESGNQGSAQVALGIPGALPSGSPTPFGLWGSLGTRASMEVLESEF